MPPLRTANSVEVLGRVKASLAALAAGAALTRPPHFTRRHLSKRRGISKTEEGRTPMTERSLTPNITVTIGHHTRIYFAFVTTAPDRARFASDGHAARGDRSRTSSASRRSRSPSTAPAAGHRRDWSSSMRWSSPGNERQYRGNQHLLLPADPGLVGLNTLQHWLWQRLQAPAASQVAA